MLGFDISAQLDAAQAILDEAPTLLPDLEPVWETWRAVSGQRSSGGAVRISEVRAYLDEEGIRRDAERRRHFAAVRILDAELMRLGDAEREAAEQSRAARRRR